MMNKLRASSRLSERERERDWFDKCNSQHPSWRYLIMLGVNTKNLLTLCCSYKWEETAWRAVNLLLLSSHPLVMIIIENCHWESANCFLFSTCSALGEIIARRLSCFNLYTQCNWWHFPLSFAFALTQDVADQRFIAGVAFLVGIPERLLIVASRADSRVHSISLVLFLQTITSQVNKMHKQRFTFVECNLRINQGILRILTTWFARFQGIFAAKLHSDH